MTFRETYRDEVIASRRDRSRRAFFWAKIVGIVLVITIGATLRAEPQLRAALADVAMNSVLKLAGTTAAPQRVAGKPSELPGSQIKINRPGGSASDDILDVTTLTEFARRSLSMGIPTE